MITIELNKLAETPWMQTAIDELARGVREVPGIAANARILRYFTSTSLRGTRLALSDETAWCSAFACWCMEQAGIRSPRSAAARSWLGWGRDVPLQIGAVCVLWRGSPDGKQGHVGFVTNQDTECVHLLGGNQGNRVRIARYPKSRVLSFRVPA